MHLHALHAVLLSLPLLLAACRDARVDAYRVPKERDADLPVTVATAGTADASGDGMTGMPVATAAGPGLVWTAPAGWQPKAPGAMRKGSYAIVGHAGATADLSITAFPGAVGGELANINRWRSQLALPPVAESDLAASVTRLSQNGLTFTLVELLGGDAAGPQRMLGAMVPCGGAMWFFKLTGPAALVAATKPAFLEFLQSVRAVEPVAP